VGAPVKFRDADTTTATISRKNPTPRKLSLSRELFPIGSTPFAHSRGDSCPIGRAYELPPRDEVCYRQ